MDANFDTLLLMRKARQWLMMVVLINAGVIVTNMTC